MAARKLKPVEANDGSYAGLVLAAFDTQEVPIDPRDPDHSRSGIFVDHNCSYCRSGELPCRQGSPNNCDYPMARND